MDSTTANLCETLEVELAEGSYPKTAYRNNNK